MKKLLVIACALALGACAAQQSGMQSADSTATGEKAEASQDSAASRSEKRKRDDDDYITSLERRDKTGSRINRVRRRGEVDDDTTAGKRVTTVSREELEDMEARTPGPIISGEE